MNKIIVAVAVMLALPGCALRQPWNGQAPGAPEPGAAAPALRDDSGAVSAPVAPERGLGIVRANKSSPLKDAIRRTAAPTPSAPLPLPLPPVPVIPAPYLAPKKDPEWTLQAGHMIGQDLQVWAQTAGWKVVWSMPRDWSVPAAATFKGDFKAAATTVIETLAANGALVRAQFYDGNKTMVITAPGASMQ